MAEKRTLYIKRLKGNEVVHEVKASPRTYERAMAGMLAHMNTDEFYIDDSEFDDVGED